MDQSTTPTASEPEVAAGKLAGNRDKRAKAHRKSGEQKRGPKRAVSTSRKYSDAERAQMMTSIAKTVEESRCTFKEAIIAAGITEQTYYQWKKAKNAAALVGEAVTVRLPTDVEPLTASASDPVGSTAKIDMPAVPGDGLDIAQLQQENLRLRQIFAEKLIAANDELRKKIATL